MKEVNRTIICFHHREKRGSPFRGYLKLKREQKRSNGKITPNHCVCSLNCVPFLVIHTIWSQYVTKKKGMTYFMCETGCLVLTSLIGLTSLNTYLSTFSISRVQFEMMILLNNTVNETCYL